MTFRFEDETYLPARVYEITGYNPENQRNLRRSGYLDKEGDGWTNLSLKDAAKLLVMGELSKVARVPPSVGREVAETAAIVILLYAFELPGAVLDAGNLNPRNEPRLHSAPGAERIRFLVWQDGRAHFLRNLDKGFHSRSFGAAIVLDLLALAERLLERAGGPLTRVVPEA
jgi:hypothetical protein